MLLLAGALATAAAPPAVADGGAGADASPGYGEEVTVRAPSRLPDDGAGAAGASVQVVDGAQLRATGARTLQEALDRLPGVHLSDEQGNRYQQDLVVRGMTASPVTGLPQGLSVFLDGVRVNEPGAEEVNFDLIPLDDVERIEVVHGPNAIFGRNTLAGAISIVTRRGGDHPEAAVEAEGGSWLQQALRGRISGPVGPLDGYLSVHESSEQGWRAVGGARSAAAFGKLGARTEDTDVTLSTQLQVDRLEEPGPLPASLLVRDPGANYTPGDFFGPSLGLIVLNVRHRLAPGLSLSVNSFFRALDTRQYNANLIAPDTSQEETTRSGGVTVQLEHRARAGPLRNELVGGAEASLATVHLVGTSEPNAGFATTAGGLPLPRVTADLSDRQVPLGAYLQDHLRVAAGPLAGLGATGAVRWDRISHAVVDGSPDAPGRASGTAAFSALTSSAGLDWALGPRWKASASWSEGFRAPAFLELTCADPTAPCVGLQSGVAPDPGLGHLRPVRSSTVEMGLSASPVDEVTVVADVYRTDLRDDIYAVTPPNTPYVFFQNVGDTRRQGLEAQARAAVGPLDLQVSYALTLATFESPLALATPRTAAGTEAVARGDRLPMIPEHRWTADGRLHALDWLDLTAGVTYVGSQYFVGDEANVGPMLPAYAVTRAGVEARWGAWTASLRATNLVGATYQTFGTFAPDARAPGQPIVPFLTPGAPLCVIAGLRWERR